MSKTAAKPAESAPSAPFKVNWYRTPLSPQQHRDVHKTSDAQGFMQCGLWFGTLSLWLVLAVQASLRGHWVSAVGWAAAYGAHANFCINGMHELGHGFVFHTKGYNEFFLRLISLLGWLHPDMFFMSHLRHHRNTMYMPQDLENPTPIRLTMQQFLEFGVVNIKGFCQTMQYTFRAAANLFPTGHLGWTEEWEATCYPDSAPQLRAPAVKWARALFLAHTCVWLAMALVSYTTSTVGWMMVPLLLSFGPFLAGFVFFLCNSTQHVGMQTHVPDFRLNSRTILLPKALQLVYWHMNFHIEHHMYAAVPCYNLGKLHEAIRHDLVYPVPNGLVKAWREIAHCVLQQRKDSSWTMPVPKAKEI